MLIFISIIVPYKLGGLIQLILLLFILLLLVLVLVLILALRSLILQKRTAVYLAIFRLDLLAIHVLLTVNGFLLDHYRFTFFSSSFFSS